MYIAVFKWQIANGIQMSKSARNWKGKRNFHVKPSGVSETTAVCSIRSFAGVHPETLHASVPGGKRSARRDATLIQSLFWASLGPYRPRIYN